MHILETYALNCAAKIKKPYIYTSFFPVESDKYVTFHSDAPYASRNYDYWQDVINIIVPFLEKNGIKLIQIGGEKDRVFDRCVSIKGKTNINQMAYVVKNSLLHFGVDSFPIHLASFFNVPLVALFSANHINCSKPYFGSPEKQVLINSYERAGLKPSCSQDENPKSINLIKPEEIANAIFKLLKIDFQVPFETVFIGPKYTGVSIQESIPNYKNIIFNPENVVEMRTDFGFDEQSLITQLSQYKKSILVLDKPINLNILSQFKQNIFSVAFKITDANNHNFLIKMRESGIKFILISDLPQDEIDKLKINYYDLGNIEKIEKPSKEKIEELKKDVDSLFYRSAKITGANDKFYYSYAAVEKGIPMNNHFEYQKVIDCPSFWENLDFFTIVKLKEKA